MHALTGTGKLLRLALRRDRVKLPIILTALAVLFASSAGATVELYKDPAQRLIYASTTAPSIVSRVFGGPIDGPHLGAIVQNETFLFTALAVAFMSSLTVVRHTRQNEEYGRSELIGSGVVSRHASLIAALIVAIGASLVFGLIAVMSLIALDLPVGGSVAFGLALASVGVIFAGVAAVTSQLADSARGANSMAALVIGVAFLLRAIGDALGRLSEDGLAVKSALPSWLSPFGWGQQLHPYSQSSWWVFILYGVFFAVLIGLAVIFMSKRDVGLGMISTRPGRAHAKRNLLSAFGLAHRLQRGVLRGWAIAVVVLGITYGAVIEEFEKIITENAELAEAFAQLGGNHTESFIGYMVSFMAIIIAGYSVQALLRMRSEEAGGQLESILGTSVSRQHWLLSHVGYVILGVAALSLLTALSMGITYVLVAGESWSWLWTIAQATLVQSLAVFAFAGFVIALFGLLPRFVVPLAWSAFSICLLVMQLGVLLRLPQWVMNFSPFGHLPIMPAQAFRLTPVISLAVIAVVLALGGLTAFRRRDIAVV